MIDPRGRPRYTQASMFDIGGPEFILLVLLGLLIFGPRRLPQIGKQLGGFIAQLRGAMRDFQGTLEREVALDDLKRAAQEVRDLKTQVGGAARQFTQELMAPLETAPEAAEEADGARQPPLPFDGADPAKTPPKTPAG